MLYNKIFSNKLDLFWTTTLFLYDINCSKSFNTVQKFSHFVKNSYSNQWFDCVHYDSVSIATKDQSYKTFFFVVEQIS